MNTKSHRQLEQGRRGLDIATAIFLTLGAAALTTIVIDVASHWPPRSLADPMHTRGVQ